MVAKAKLTEEQKTEIRARFAADGTLTKAAVGKEYGVDATTITRLLAAGAGDQAALVPTTPAPSIAPLYRLADIRPSPLNPRKTFDPDGISQLAESIKSQGLLQNLVIRDAGDGAYQVVAGERRYRALTLLAERGEWDRDAAIIPARVVEATDGDHLAIALLENLQRQDVNPMEEAEAFAQLQALDPEKWSPRSIAEAIGMTPRHVQLRLALVNKLCDELKEGLRNGTVSLAHARVLAPLPLKLQTKHVANLGNLTATELANRIRWDLIPVDRASFDLDTFKGQIIEDENGERYFASKAEFKKAQAAHAKKIAEEYLKAGVWPFVTVAESWEAAPPAWKYQIGAEDGGVLILITKNGEGPVAVFEKVAEREQHQKNAVAEAKRLRIMQARKILQDRMHPLAHDFLARLAAALRDHPNAAIRLALFCHIGKNSPYTRDTLLRAPGGVLAASVAKGMPLAVFEPFLCPAERFSSYGGDKRYFDPEQNELELWQMISDRINLPAAYAAAIAGRLQLEIDEPLSPVLEALATELGTEIPEILQWSEGRRDRELDLIAEEIEKGGQAADPQAAE